MVSKKVRFTVYGFVLSIFLVLMSLPAMAHAPRQYDLAYDFPSQTPDRDDRALGRISDRPFRREGGGYQEREKSRVQGIPEPAGLRKIHLHL